MEKHTAIVPHPWTDGKGFAIMRLQMASARPRRKAGEKQEKTQGNKALSFFIRL